MSQVRKKMDLTLILARHQHKLHPVCQLCGSTSPLRLHHILRRGLYNQHEIIDRMPLIFHALICDKCNDNRGPIPVDHPLGRAKMLAANMDMFGGLKALIEAIDEWNAIVPNGWNDEIVSYEQIIHEYEELKHASE